VSRHDDRDVTNDRQVGFNPVLGFLSVSTGGSIGPVTKVSSFNPVLGFLSVSTVTSSVESPIESSFNPVLGFLSVSTYSL